MEPALFLDSQLPPELDERIRSELRDGERLLWVGQPRPDRFARQALPLMLFGIPFTAFAVFWIVAATAIVIGGFWGIGAGGFGAFFACFPLFGVPFVLIGIGLLTAPHWFRRRAQKTCYALTDRRAILWNAGLIRNVSVRSYGPDALRKTHRTDYADGCGDLIFEEIVSEGTDSDGFRTTHTTRHGFLAIDDVRSVEDLMHKVLGPPAVARRAPATPAEDPDKV